MATNSPRSLTRVRAATLAEALPLILNQIYGDSNTEQVQTLTDELLRRFQQDPLLEITLHGDGPSDETVLSLTDLPYPTDVAPITIQPNMAICDAQIIWWENH